jgi:hypothetical protein
VNVLEATVLITLGVILGALTIDVAQGYYSDNKDRIHKFTKAKSTKWARETSLPVVCPHDETVRNVLAKADAVRAEELGGVFIMGPERPAGPRIRGGAHRKTLASR